LHIFKIFNTEICTAYIYILHAMCEFVLKKAMFCWFPVGSAMLCKKKLLQKPITKHPILKMTCTILRLRKHWNGQ